MLNVHGLRVFVATAEAGGIRPAAERLGRTPPAVSMALKQLEEELGAPLFQGERKATLTELGELTLVHARDVLAHFDGMAEVLQAFAHNQVGRTRVASVNSVSVTFLPEAVRHVLETMPGSGVELRQIESHLTTKAVRDSVVDIAFASYLAASDDVLFEPLFRDRIDIICAENHALASLEGPQPWSVLADHMFIANDSFGSVSAPDLRAIAVAAPLRAASVPNLLELVRCGLGISVLPRLCRYGARGVRFIPAQDPAAFRLVGMMTKRDRPQLPLTQRLAEAMRQVIRARAEELQYELVTPR
jgi:LysR family carnitine catabolism transcriptional activator